MKDIPAHIAKLRADATDCDALGETIEAGKRAFFMRLAERLRHIADEMEQALAEAQADQGNNRSRH
jgi:hypothetical protein